MSHAFARLAELRAGAGLTIENFTKAVKDNSLPGATSYDADGEKHPYILPAYPVGMVIAKDITIKVETTQEDSSLSKHFEDNSWPASGGILCFSASASSSSSSSSETAYHGESHGNYYLRIPGPQILGYFLQFVPKDLSKKYEPMYTDGKDNEFVKALQFFDKSMNIAKLRAGAESSVEAGKIEEPTAQTEAPIST